ncbi:unnamed protein product [Echinostoma caproni]|uniref:Fungal_trans domain-containing protein n=1 Tax=Echinostoma caproni TaxID=27848 RepID=A0A183AE76_9TREM|nr:unnamed protein product [Echinostoma caproni]
MGDIGVALSADPHEDTFEEPRSSYKWFASVLAFLVIDFEILLQTLTELSGGKRVTLDSSFLELHNDAGGSPNKTHQWTNGHDKRCVQSGDLVALPWSSSDSLHEKNNIDCLIWMSAHVAVIEVILRIHLSQIVTQKRMIDALSVTIFISPRIPLPGSVHEEIESTNRSIVSDLRLYRARDMIPSPDCTDWLENHLLDDESRMHVDSISSSASSNTIGSDTVDDTADRFLRGLAMANLLALAFHFYRPELAPEEDFYFNFGPGGELEPAASHHNARTVASICRAQSDELLNLLALMPPACYDTHDQEAHRRSVTLNHVTLLGFCSQGLARSPAHRRLQNATLAAELFVWVSRQAPDRQIPPIRVSHVLSGDLHESNNHVNQTNLCPGPNHATTPTTVPVYRSALPRTESEYSAPLYGEITHDPYYSSTGMETYRLTGHGHELALNTDHVSRERPDTQAGNHSPDCFNRPTDSFTQPFTCVTDVLTTTGGGMFYAPTVPPSDNGFPKPFRLADRTGGSQQMASSGLTEQNKVTIMQPGSCKPDNGFTLNFEVKYVDSVL